MPFFSLTIEHLLTVLALLIAIAAGVGRAPLWPAVLLLAVALLLPPYK